MGQLLMTADKNLKFVAESVRLFELTALVEKVESFIRARLQHLTGDLYLNLRAHQPGWNPRLRECSFDFANSTQVYSCKMQGEVMAGHKQDDNIADQMP